MTRRRGWLRHPPRTIGPAPTCPAGPRYRSLDLAQQARGSHAARLTIRPCTCGGWHITDQEPTQ